MSTRTQRLAFGVVATLVGAIGFVVASAYLVLRGQPHWLAGAVGALAFPVGPLGWHLLGERARRRKLAAAKTPSKSTLTAGDRYWLRFVAVALLVIGPMVAIGKLDVVRAVWRHGLWWWPAHHEAKLTHGGPLSTIGSGAQRTFDVVGTPLARVPSDAELVFVVEPPPEEAQGARGVAAWGDGQMMVAAEGKNLDRELGIDGDPEAKLAELNKVRHMMPWLPTDEIVLVSHTDTQLIAASAGWRARVAVPGTGPSPAIMRELGRAPKDAVLIAAFVPRTTRDVRSTRAGAAWLAKQGDNLVLEARIEALDDAAAAQLASEISSALRGAVGSVAEGCREPVGKLVDAVQLDQTGAIVSARIPVDGGALMGVMFCAMQAR